MARIAASPERYQAFLDAFLTLGPRFGPVALRVGSTASTARNLWEKGWPGKPYAAPISAVYDSALKRLQEVNKPKTPELPQREIESAPQMGIRLDALEQRVEVSIAQRTSAQILQDSSINAVQTEVDLLQAFRCNLIGAVTVSSNLLKGFEVMAQAAAEQAITAAQNAPQMTLERVLKPMERFARLMASLASSSKVVMESQRLLVGAPQQITEQRGSDSQGGDLVERMARVGSVIEQLKRAGLVPGGTTIDASEYVGEETNAHTHATMPSSAVSVPPPPIDIERSGNVLPTDDEESSNSPELQD
jgi:hypothetical protein